MRVILVRDGYLCDRFYIPNFLGIWQFLAFKGLVDHIYMYVSALFFIMLSRHGRT